MINLYVHIQLCKNQKCVTRQLEACPSVFFQECSGNGVRYFKNGTDPYSHTATLSLS